MRKENQRRKRIHEELNFGGRLRYIRTRAGLRQDELAARMGVLPAQISSWESNKHEIGLYAAIALADVFGITIGQLCGREPITKDDDFELCMRF